MLPAIIENHTTCAGKPKDWDAAKSGHCGGLAVRVEQYDGLVWMVSAWRPSPDELAALNRGACINLRLSAPQHPVVGMSVGPVPGAGEPSGLQYVHSTKTSNPHLYEVWEEDKQQPVSRPGVSCSVPDGWVEVYVTDAMDCVVVENGHPKTERLPGRYSIRWRR
jgi:hypothetical protein